MNRETKLLLHEVQPRLRGAIPTAVPIVGTDDIDELVQDGIVIAVQIYRRARKAGKKVTPGNLTYYTLLHLRAGRRSTGFRKSDVHHPAAQLSGHVRLQSLDQPVCEDEHGEETLTLHDCLAAPGDDPATSAARSLDWASVLDSLDRAKKAILIALVEGTELTMLVRRLGKSRSSLQDHSVPSVSLCNERPKGEQWAAQARMTGVSQAPDREANRKIQLELAAASAAL
jgi:hypothetical protein